MENQKRRQTKIFYLQSGCILFLFVTQEKKKMVLFKAASCLHDPPTSPKWWIELARKVHIYS